MAWCAHSPVSSWNPVARVACSLGGRNQYKKDIIEVRPDTAVIEG